MAFLAVLAVGHAGSLPARYNARLGSGRGSWSGLWAPIVARAGYFSRDCVPCCRAAQGHGKPQFQHMVFLCCPAAVSVSHRPSSSLLRDSHSTTAAALQALPIVTAMDGASVYVCVASVCAVGPRSTIKSGATGFAFWEYRGCRARRWKPTFALNFKL